MHHCRSPYRWLHELFIKMNKKLKRMIIDLCSKLITINDKHFICEGKMANY
jgi:hypothetical protein